MKRSARITAAGLALAMLPGLLLPGGVTLSFCLHEHVLHLGAEARRGDCCPLARTRTAAAAAEGATCCGRACCDGGADDPGRTRQAPQAEADMASCCVDLLLGRNEVADPAERGAPAALPPAPVAAPAPDAMTGLVSAAAPRPVREGAPPPPGILPLRL